jgi:cytidylate kinase
MPKRVIAISREAGTEGNRIAGLVAERLGYRYVDEEIITTAAEKQGVDPAAIADAEKRKSLMLRVLEGIGEGGMATATPGGVTWIPDDSSEIIRSNDFRSLIREAIHETAAKGDVVIVAHAASFALAGRDDLLRVLVTAPHEARVRRVAEERRTDEHAAAKDLKRSDEDRADYLKRFYGVDHEQPSHYDLVVNSEVLGAEGAAGLVVDAAKA